MARRTFGFCPLLISVLCVAAAQSVTYNRSQYPSKGFPSAQADLNGDGILDLVTIGSGSTGKTGFYLTLSNPDGSYQSPVAYSSPYSGGFRWRWGISTMTALRQADPIHHGVTVKGVVIDRHHHGR
jgi:hypothetical protein